MSDTNAPGWLSNQLQDQDDNLAECEQIAMNDAVTGETVLPGVGEGKDQLSAR